jgi:flagellar M-ring protein FliF
VSGFSRTIEIFRSLEARAQIALAASAVGVLVTLVVLFNYASRPSYVTLASGVAAAESGQIAKSLEGAGITYQLKDGGSTVAVEKGSEARARVALAQDGLPTGGHLGFELFDKASSLGTTDFEQKVEYQRALEGEIARTIEAVDGVQAAEVRLVLPRNSVFLDDGTAASAAVLLNGGGMLGRDAIFGIARLVSSSVENLDPKNVTITDDGGSLLWPTDGAGDGATAKLEAEQRYGSQLSAQIDSMLTSTLGVGKAMARVHATLDLDRTTIDKVTYGKTGVPITATLDSEQLGGKAGAPGAAGSAGIASNLPGYSGSATAASAASKGATYARSNGTTEYGVDKQVQSTTIAPGAVKKLDVALVVDKSIPASQVAQLEKSVGSLAGLDLKRGDTITTSQVEFAKAKASTPLGPGMLEQFGGPLGVGKWALIVLATGAFLFMVRKGLKKREGESLGPEPTWLREISSSRSLQELEAATQVLAPRAPDASLVHRQQVTSQVEEIARHQPEQLAQQVTQWMHD